MAWTFNSEPEDQDGGTLISSGSSDVVIESIKEPSILGVRNPLAVAGFQVLFFSSSFARATDLVSSVNVTLNGRIYHFLLNVLDQIQFQDNDLVGQRQAKMDFSIAPITAGQALNPWSCRIFTLILMAHFPWREGVVILFQITGPAISCTIVWIVLVGPYASISCWNILHGNKMIELC